MLLIRAAVLLLLYLVHFAACAEDFYKILGLGKDASDKEIKSAYRKLAKKYHPDKNPGDESVQEKFVQVSEAYEVLTDPQTRNIYDRYGHEGLKQDQGGAGHQHHNPFDLFNHFFGGGGHFNSAQQRRGPDQEIRVAIALRDFYNGATTEFSWNRQHVCEACDGTGSANKVVDKCAHCDGRGVHLIRKQLAPGMFQSAQRSCDRCGGTGKTMKKACSVCQGHRVVKRMTPVQLTVGRGAAKNSRTVYESEADAHPDYAAGNLVITLVEKEPNLGDDNPDHVDGAFFRRKGNDLFWREVLSLREAWMGGWTRNLTHLDGHVVRLGRDKGRVVQPGHVDTVPNEGMPLWHEDGDSVFHDTQFGKLYVEYVVVLPDQMDKVVSDEFWDLWEKWRAKVGVDLAKDGGRPGAPAGPSHDEL